MASCPHCHVWLLPVLLLLLASSTASEQQQRQQLVHLYLQASSRAWASWLLLQLLTFKVNGC
jgi:hypothetical protein